MPARTLAAPGGPKEERPRSAREQLDDFAGSLVGLSADGVTVQTAHAAFKDRPDVGDTIIQIRLGLSDPPLDKVTWPVSAIRRFEREIRGRSYDAGFEEFVYVDIGSASDATEDTGDGDAGEAEDGGGLRRDRIPLSDERPDLR